MITRTEINSLLREYLLALPVSEIRNVFSEIKDIHSQVDTAEETSVQPDSILAISVGPEPLEKDVIFRDPQTGLMWLSFNSKPSKELNWYYATIWAKSIDYGGFSDWRLPTKDELDSLALLAGDSPSVWFPANGFKNILSNYYWSSSTDPKYSRGAEVVGVGNGYWGYGFKVDSYDVIPVRSDNR